MTFSKTIINWYSANARKLPWRESTDPYLIWVSEIIMQQTRIEQGLSYYLRFIEAFPNLPSLSKAKEDEVLKLWEGLGYYSRARNMMFAAKQVEEIYNGVFPSQYHDILKLKGIGPYTAAAISSFAFGLPYAVVDGNVSRVLSRYYGIHTPINSHQGKKIFSELAQENLNHKDPATYNQAIMEFGALQCKPANPNCTICPLSNSCMALSSNSISLLPKKEKKLKVLNKYLHFFFIQKNDQFLIEKRDNKSIWKGLYQLPLIETKQDENTENIFKTSEFIDIIGEENFILKSVQEVNHKLTHRNLFIRFYQLDIRKFAKHSYLQVNMSDLQSLAFPRPIEKYLEAFKHQ